MMLVGQDFTGPVVPDVVAAVREELRKVPLLERIKPGATVAIPVGSRGIANLALIIKTLVEELRALGAIPFIVPSMGSHGGATAEGQRAIVEGYGVTEEYTGAPIKASMDVVQVTSLENGVPVYFDRYAYEADHVVVVGRVKPHTDFSGDLESGLHKMMLIGLGKHQGATVYHKAFADYSFDYIVRSVGRAVIEKCKVLLGLAIVENPNEETALISAVAPQDFLEREKELLILAKQWMPRIPFPEVDLLIVDQMGKNISGTGMDTNVIGRKDYVYPCSEEVYPKVRRVYVRDLTEETHGNATGIGIADFTHGKLVKKIDFRITYLNCITGNNPKAAAIPLHYDSDKEVLEAALNNIGYVEPENAAIVRIRNTLELKEIWVSNIYQSAIEAHESLRIIEQPRDMAFDEGGNLLPF
jgi:hypothetical protein